MTKQNAPNATRNSRIEIDHRHYRIIAGQREKTHQAIGYLGTRKVESTSAETVDDAVERLKFLLDERLRALRNERVDGVPTAAEFEEAARALGIRSFKRLAAFVATHRRCRGNKATVKQLAVRLNTEPAAIVTEYRTLGKRLGTLLDFTPEPDGLDRMLAPLLVIAQLHGDWEVTRMSLELRPQLMNAFAETSPTSDVLAGANPFNQHYG